MGSQHLKVNHSVFMLLSFSLPQGFPFKNIEKSACACTTWYPIMPPLPKAIFFSNTTSRKCQKVGRILSYEPDDNHLWATHEQCQMEHFAGNYFVPNRNKWVGGSSSKGLKHWFSVRICLFVTFSPLSLKWR